MFVTKARSNVVSLAQYFIEVVTCVGCYCYFCTSCAIFLDERKKLPPLMGGPIERQFLSSVRHCFIGNLCELIVCCDVPSVPTCS